ncbi:hypothetical protein [Streptomyces gilvus]|uniref:hypothetical protein n=1 Tax=Streptomyces gilvus TaxID=2920937 RepID=UPI001F1052C9|nr:hypothetical protein [Streptomyces sp. CME 23]MCH5677922.1 hypothetical protein [Streptomyces sp. CME 23]
MKTDRTTTPPPPATVDRVEGLDRVRRQVLAGSTGLPVESRAAEAAAVNLLLAAAGHGDEAARTTLATLNQLPCAWRELRARVPLSLARRLSLGETPDPAVPQPLAVSRCPSRTCEGLPLAGVTA